MEIRSIAVDQDDPQTGYAQLSTVVAEITKVIAKDNYVLVGLRDFAGQEITALIRGRSKPNQGNIGKIAVFKVSGKTGNDGVRYSGFYNPNDDIPAQYQGKRPAGGGNGGGSKGGNSGGDVGKNRGVTLSYAKDLAIAGVISMKQLPATATIFAEYVATGTWPSRQGSVVEPELEIPETDDPYAVGNYEDGGYEEDTNAPVTETYGQDENPF